MARAAVGPCMPYRSEHDTREARREALALALAQVRDDRANERGAARDLDGEERRLLRALRELRLPRQRASLPIFLWDRIEIASPCGEDWSAMVGDARARRCSTCERDVFDLSAMTRADIASLLATRGEPPCVRFYRRADGTVLTADDCPTPPALEATRALVAAACAVAAVAAAASLTSASGHEPEPCELPSARATQTVAHEYPEGGRHVMGRGPSPSLGPATPRPPWERAEIVAEGARALAHLRGIAADPPE